MTRARTLRADERGLIGKILILWIVLGALLLVAAIDTAQILVTRYNVANAAQEAAFEAGSTYRSSRGDRQAAYRAALQVVEEAGAETKLARFVIDDPTGRVTVTVTRRAPTLLAGRIGFTKDLTRVKATETSEPASP